MNAIVRVRIFAFLVVIATITSTPAQAAKLVVLAVNSGRDFTAPYINTDTPNLLPPGAKGFLIGIDLQDDLQDVPLGIQRVKFTGVIHQQGMLDELGDPYPTPVNIKTRSQGMLQQAIDGVANAGYLRSDSYVMDNPQQGTYVWTPVGPGFEGGDQGDNFLQITASLGIPTAIDGPGPVQLAYIVTTGDVPIRGLLARGQVGFDPLGNQNRAGGTALLDFSSEQIVPEPSSL